MGSRKGNAEGARLALEVPWSVTGGSTDQARRFSAHRWGIQLVGEPSSLRPHGYLMRVNNIKIPGVPVGWSSGGPNHNKGQKYDAYKMSVGADIRMLFESLLEIPLEFLPFDPLFDWGGFAIGIKVHVNPDDTNVSNLCDLTNMKKAVEDSLTGVVWPDDSPRYVNRHFASKIQIEDSRPSATYVTLECAFSGIARRDS